MCSHGVAEGGGRGAGAGWAERIARKRRGLARRGIGQWVRCHVLSRPRVGDSDLAGGTPPHGGSVQVHSLCAHSAGHVAEGSQRAEV